MARLTPEALIYDLVSAGDPQVSPDGTRVVYSVGSADRERDRATSQLWLSDIDGANPRRLTWTGERNREARWSPDGRSIAFVSDRLQGSSGLFVLPLDGPGEARELSSRATQAAHTPCCASVHRPTELTFSNASWAGSPTIFPEERL
jgi:Tol biopolymer transport system component